MTDNKTLIRHIVEAVREKKGKNVCLVDMSGLGSSVCDCFVICEGNSNTQINALADNVYEYLREHDRTKPFGIEGERNALWVAMDYGDVMVHIFDRNTRRFYDLEHLWSDAEVTALPDED